MSLAIKRVEIKDRSNDLWYDETDLEAVSNEMEKIYGVKNPNYYSVHISIWVRSKIFQWYTVYTQVSNIFNFIRPPILIRHAEHNCIRLTTLLNKLLSVNQNNKNSTVFVRINIFCLIEWTAFWYYVIDYWIINIHPFDCILICNSLLLLDYINL